MGMEIVELVMRLEEEFGITIEDREAEHFTTPGAVCDLIERKLGLVSRMSIENAQERPNVWPLLSHIIADELDLPLEKVTRDADFVRDLGLS